MPSSSTKQSETNEGGETESLGRLHGILVSYKDDEINGSVHSALKRKLRVRYKCMDTSANFLAFGTSGGAIYLFKLTQLTHSSCYLLSIIPCDQGSIEVIKFLPSAHAEDLLVAIGTSRGSLVVFRLVQPAGEQSPICSEIYKAESFTNNWSIKLLECDVDLFDPISAFTKLYICDTANRIYVLESNTIHSYKHSLRLFYSNHLPSLIFSANDSKINQISVHKSQLLISTDETTRLYNEQKNQISVIGKKARKAGFYGACFFNPNYRPNKLVSNAQQTNYSSTASLNELENLLMFVARPLFRLWQVNHQLSVMFTHQFEPLIKSCEFNRVIDLCNQPIGEDEEDDPADLLEKFARPAKIGDRNEPHKLTKLDHFQKIVPIYSLVLGNLLLSYGPNELFVIDPIGAKLIVWHQQDAPIVQVCCNENEIFIWSVAIDGDQRQFHVDRLVLLAPTQFVLELHRIHRYFTLAMFVELFSEQFREKMALPLCGQSVITTEGGLLRNVLLNAWDMCKSSQSVRFSCQVFKEIVDEIIDESRQLKRSLENLTDSRFLLNMTNENIDRLCMHPYASLVSLEVSIADLHSNHVIHYSKDALNIHKSVTNLSENLRNGLISSTKSQFDLSGKPQPLDRKSRNGSMQKITDTKVIVERHRPRRAKIVDAPAGNAKDEDEGKTITKEPLSETQPFFSFKESAERSPSRAEAGESTPRDECDTDELPSLEEDLEDNCEADLLSRCENCRWPYPRVHLKETTYSKRTELKWVEDNLLSRFEENIEQIEKRAFEFGLWELFIKCLAFKNRLDDYIICCLMLDDIRLLDIEQFVITRCGEDDVIDRLLVHLNRKIEMRNQERNHDHIKPICLKCEREIDTETRDDSTIEQLQDDELSFNLVNLFELFMSRRNADVKRVINCLLEYPKLLNSSKIPSTFYLKAIEMASQTSNQKPKSRLRFDQLLGSNEILLQ